MSEGQKKIPIYSSPGGGHVDSDTIPPDTTIREADAVSGKPLDHIPVVGEKRSDGKPFHGGIYNKEAKQIDCHMHE